MPVKVKHQEARGVSQIFKGHIEEPGAVFRRSVLFKEEPRH